MVLEVDGAYHLDVAQAGADAKRARRLTTPTRVILNYKKGLSIGPARS